MSKVAKRISPLVVLSRVCLLCGLCLAGSAVGLWLGVENVDGAVSTASRIYRGSLVPSAQLGLVRDNLQASQIALFSPTGSARHAPQFIEAGAKALENYGTSRQPEPLRSLAGQVTQGVEALGAAQKQALLLVASNPGQAQAQAAICERQLAAVLGDIQRLLNTHGGLARQEAERAEGLRATSHGIALGFLIVAAAGLVLGVYGAVRGESWARRQ